ncbi:hypothetical protein JYB62_08070 [Algoriphagus lutimaris]|uniref:glycosyltransferase 87 family protein n=1 Tax=Algoriphagus lutimaris TaxID=613197 RepID=UPI00196B7FB2|nr:glycosyltransferase 87 family protein [Algoriphagus lutimaris]MBN3519957.1 hypothetical protein [Algoriphagus lutimaris]
MKENLKRVWQLLLWLILAVGIYFLSEIPRDSFGLVLLVYSCCFAALLLIYRSSNFKIHWLGVFTAGLFLRLLLFNSTPQWSEDYARFLWDGELIRIHQNPYLETPSDWIATHAQDSTSFLDSLFGLMNSPNYYSVYPPSNQLLFFGASYLSKQNVSNGIIWLRMLLILSEVGVFILLWKLLRGDSKLILYWLNPFVILELSGNLHFEGLVLLALLLSLWAFKKQQFFASGSFWSLAVGLKILPLMLLPSFLGIKTVRKSAGFWVGGIIVFGICFLPLVIDNSWKSLQTSLLLYQGKFEFNASVYYLLREVGFWIKGYNTIATLTKILSGITFLGIIYISWKKKTESMTQLAEMWVLIYLVYLLLQPIIHPWYIIPAFGLSLLTQMKSMVFWTFSAILSYHAYSQVDFIENPWILFLEYLIVGIGLAWDFKKDNFNLKPIH